MIVAILMGKKKSTGFPGKNMYPVLGRSMMEYPLIAAVNSQYVDDIFVTTDDDQIKKKAQKYGAKVINRPKELCTSTALGEDVFVHAYNYIKKNFYPDIEAVVLLMCNAATVTSELIDLGIKQLRKDKSVDSAVSVSAYNMWSPLRARKIDSKGLLKPFIPFEYFDNNKNLSCDRDSQGDVWFADMGVSVVRPRCIENIHEGLLPQRWMGKNIYPLKQWGGFDIDYEWQMPILEYWIKKHPLKKSAVKRLKKRS